MDRKQYQWLDVHTHHLPEDPNVGAVLNIRFPRIPALQPAWYSAGIHPWDVEDIGLDESLVALEKFIKEQRNNTLAIGETGLDALRGPSIEVQKKAFLKQASLGDQFKKPLIIHCVKCWDDLIQLKKLHKPTVPWIIHGFQKSVPLAESLFKHGFYFSLGAALCRKGLAWTEFFNRIPIEYCLVETDDQQEWTISQITQAMSRWSGVEEEKLRLLLHSNFQKIFHEFS